MLRSGNPALRSETFMAARPLGGNDVMTIQGTVHKSAILIFILLLPAIYVWNQFFSYVDQIDVAQAKVMPLMMIGLIGGLVIAIVTIFKKNWSPITAPLYAAFEGLALGGISAFFEIRFPGIVVQAVGLTFMVFFGLLLAYQSKLIKPTENFKLGVAAATGGIFLFYLLQMILSFFGISIPYIHESGVIGIGFSLFVVVVASLNLVMDFDFIEEGAMAGAPKYMEWYAGFGLLVTLVWLYLEILRLLSKLKER